VRIDCRRLTNLNVSRLGLGNLNSAIKWFGWTTFASIAPAKRAAHLQWQVDQDAVNSGANFERVQLLLFQFRERTHLVHPGLLFSHLRFDCFLIDIQPFILDVVSRSKFVGFALRCLVCQT